MSAKMSKKTSAENNDLWSLAISNSLEKLHSTDVVKESATRDRYQRYDLKPNSNKTCYTCEICMKSFDRRRRLQYHRRTHSVEEHYHCKVCMKSFTCGYDLRQHFRTHTGEKPYGCEVCKKSFSQKSTLRSHIRIHTGEKPFSCKVCQSSFAHWSNLRIHLKKHTGEKPYSCEICKKSFVELAALKRHVRTHTGEKPFICHTCEKSFGRRTLLQQHFRTHLSEIKPFTCPIVSTQTTKPHLSNLMDGERSACEGFIDAMGLSVTATLSSGHKLFVCKFCYKSFPSTEAFRRHTEKPDFEKTCRLSNLNGSHLVVEKQPLNAQMHSGRIKCIGQDEYFTSLVAPAAEMIRDFNFDEKSESGDDCTFIVKLYGCGICDEKFRCEISFLEHCTNHKSVIYTEFWCQS